MSRGSSIPWFALCMLPALVMLGFALSTHLVAHIVSRSAAADTDGTRALVNWVATVAHGGVFFTRSVRVPQDADAHEWMRRMTADAPVVWKYFPHEARYTGNPGRDTFWRWIGFGYDAWTTKPRHPDDRQVVTRELAFRVPFWPIVLMLTVLPIAPGRRLFRERRASRRRRSGLCPHCGYDVRASPVHCPECGHAVGTSPGA